MTSTGSGEHLHVSSEGHKIINPPSSTKASKEHSVVIHQSDERYREHLEMDTPIKRKVP